ncbi:MAG: c-type cytochrome [Gammaproteobacteria bacterium]
MSLLGNRPLGGLATITVVVVGCFAFAIGFILLPAAEPQATLWERICRAAGSSTAIGANTGGAALPGFTSVVLPASAMTRGTPLQIGRGATLALRCTACHGAQGLSGANAPNLAGQYPEVIYKQLVDFKRGARSDAVMGALVAALTEKDMLDLAHYYAYLPRQESDQPLAAAPPLVRVGDPMRNIAPCASCHGSQDGKTGAPALEGEPQTYLRTQLTAFATGTRKNDPNAVMRGEVRRMTAAEIDGLARHYAGVSPENAAGAYP